MPQHKNDSPHLSRYDNVDVLSLLDPNWIERSQAGKLMQMVADAQRAAGDDRQAEPEPLLSL